MPSEPKLPGSHGRAEKNAAVATMCGCCDRAAIRSRAWHSCRCQSGGSRSLPISSRERNVSQRALYFLIRRDSLRGRYGPRDCVHRFVHGGPQTSVLCASRPVFEQRTHRRSSKVRRTVLGIVERQIRRLNRHAIFLSELVAGNALRP